MRTNFLFLIFIITLYFYLTSSLGKYVKQFFLNYKISIIVGWWPGIVRFSNSVCNTLEGYSGTCYRRLQCTNIGGTMSGACANGIGACCLCK